MGQIVIPLEPVFITASRLYSNVGADTREILLLDKTDIARLPVQSTEELLQYIGAVGTAKRGQGNIQSDYSLRGSSFEQVLVMVDGIRMNNPQTGHHNCNLPVLLSQVQRVEVMPGHGSALYGPDSFGGVIHIITHVPERNQSTLECMGGSFNTWTARFSQALQLDNTITQLGIEKQQSDGYRFDTDYDIWRLTGRTQLDWGNKSFTLSTGFLDKDFGANGFYADTPSYESTQALDGQASFQWYSHSKQTVKADLYFNRHKDHFILDIDHPTWYQANHTTWTKGFRISSSYQLARKKEVAFGYEIFEESIKSDQLGNHNRYRQGLFGEIAFPISCRANFHSGIRIDHQDQLGWEVNPTLGLRYHFNSHVGWRISAGRAYRTPSFIELYNPSPMNAGNPALYPEYAWCGETGFSFSNSLIQFEITAFLRDEKDRIDWIRYSSHDPWQVTNVGNLRQTGFSLSFQNSSSHDFTFQTDYTFLHHEHSNLSGAESKYLHIAPRHHIVFRGGYHWRKRVQLSIIWDFSDRFSEGFLYLIDSKLIIPRKHFMYHIDVNNLFNIQYEEIPHCPMPGRQIRAGMTFKK